MERITDLRRYTQRTIDGRVEYGIYVEQFNRPAIKAVYSNDFGRDIEFALLEAAWKLDQKAPVK